MTKIQVTQEHIDNGVHCHSFKCPIALAVGALLNEKSFVRISDNCASFGPVNNFIVEDWTQLPEKTQKFVTEFDLRKKVVPTELEIDIPEKYLKS